MNDFTNNTTVNINYRLNNYILTSEIRRGGHGIVYQAYHENKPDEKLAIKVIDDIGKLDTLLIEPELLSKLNHPNINSLKDYFLHSGKLVMVMEYIDGLDLQTYLTQYRRLTISEIKDFLTQMADALSHAHTNNIIHRDIKLSNILVTEYNGAKRYVLVDFGISRIAEGIQTLKRVGGTYYYMAPEQLRGRPCYQSDLWGLGVCAYILMTGTKPFEGDTKEDVSTRIFFSIPQLPSTITHGTDNELEKIIYHLLEKQLINRTSSADELHNELKKCFVTISQKDNQQPNKKHSDTESIPSWEKSNLKAIKKNWILFWVFAFVAFIPDGILGQIIIMAGAFLFLIGQEKKKKTPKKFTVGGLLIIICGCIVSLIISGIIDQRIMYYLQISAEKLFRFQADYALFGGLIYLLPLHYFAKARRLERDTFLLKTLRIASIKGEKLLDHLKDFIDIHPADMNVNQKYIETLLLHARIKEAIVESKRALQIDPYNFGVNLLLAHGYFDICLYQECIQVCNNYLAVSPYSFEFSDLKEQCKQHVGDVYGI